MSDRKITKPVVAASLLWLISSLLALVLFNGPTAVAQTATGSIAGTVTDSTDAAIAGAKVILTNTSTNESRDAITNPTGYYSFQLLPPGQYRLVVSQSGFRQFTQNNVRLDVGISFAINVRLQIGTVTETTTVSADQEVLESQSSSLSQVIDTREISNLPTNGRNSYSFTTLVPGVVAPTGFT